MMTRHNLKPMPSGTMRACWALLLMGVSAGAALANGGPFVVKYPGGDPGARGSMARVGEDLMPGREERLRIVKEDLSITFIEDPVERSGAFIGAKGAVARPAARVEGRVSRRQAVTKLASPPCGRRLPW